MRAVPAKVTGDEESGKGGGGGFIAPESVDSICLNSTARHGGQLAPMLYHGRNNWIDVTERSLLVAAFVAAVVCMHSIESCLLEA